MSDLQTLVRERLGAYFAKWVQRAFSTNTDRDAAAEAYAEACAVTGLESRPLIWNNGAFWNDSTNKWHRYRLRPHGGLISRSAVSALAMGLGRAGISHASTMFVWAMVDVLRQGERRWAVNGAFMSETDLLVIAAENSAPETLILPTMDLLLTEGDQHVAALLSPNERQHLAAVVRAFSHCAVLCDGDDCTVAFDRPVECHLNHRGLHSDTGPAVVYGNGERVFALDGVIVPPELILTPPDQFDPQIMLHERNVEVRQRIVQKIGIERVLRSTKARSIDSWNGYSLFLLNLGDGRRRPYLKMKNPSTGEYHIEGVHPDCKTVKEALAWRNHQLSKYSQPEAMT